MKMKVIFSILVTAVITGTLVYIFKPSKNTIQTIKWNVKKSTQLSCSTKLGATFFPNPNFEKEELESVEGSLFSIDKTKAAIEIGDKTMKFLTATSVEAGMTEPATFLILRNDEKNLVAVDPETDIAINPGINTFVLNKESGLAVWTKSKPAFLTTPLPDSQIYYMECR